MKNRWSGVIVAILITAMLAAIWICDRPTTAAADDAERTVVAEQTLGEWEGRLALFDGDGALPSQVYDVWIATLPEAEQQRLKTGISIPDEQTLWSLLEDYTG